MNSRSFPQSPEAEQMSTRAGGASPAARPATDAARPSRSEAPHAPRLASDLPDLSQDEILRYSRHLIIPDVGLSGQRKLKAARVLLIGAGGLGSPLALYLSAAGVGNIGIVDFD